MSLNFTGKFIPIKFKTEEKYGYEDISCNGSFGGYNAKIIVHAKQHSSRLFMFTITFLFSTNFGAFIYEDQTRGLFLFKLISSYSISSCNKCIFIS